ncbi:MAG: hypothetical protein ACREHE_13245 [Rhizomicrobium sp.]
MQEETGTARSGRLRLLEALLSHAGALKLDAGQLSRLNDAYWNSAAQLPLESIFDLLSPEQFRQAALLYVHGDAGAAAADETLDSRIARAASGLIAEKFKDGATVEVEIAAKVASRLIDWSRIFAYCVAIPLALLFLIFGLFGYSRFEDVRTAADRIDATVSAAETKLNGEVEHARKVSGDFDKRIAGLSQSSEHEKDQIAQLQHSVARIESKLGDSSAQVETGNAAPGAAYRDLDGGWIYGPWALTDKEAGALVTQDRFPFRAAFQRLSPGTQAFVDAWHKLGAQQAAPFREAQRAYFDAQVLTPAAAAIRSRTGLDITTRPQGTKDAVLVVYRESPPLLNRVIDAMKSSGQWTPATQGFDARFINALFDRLEAMPMIQHAPLVKANMERQRNAALAKLNGSSP